MCVHIWMYRYRVWCMNAFFTFPFLSDKCELTAGSDEKKHSAAPPGIELGSSDCRSDALTTELRSHDRNCVRIFVFHQTVSSASPYEVTQVFEPTNT